MKPLIVLMITFVLALAVSMLLSGDAGYYLSGRVAMAVMLGFTAMGHFLYTKGMVMMMPDFIPSKKLIVQLTGIIELAAAIGLMVPGVVKLTGWLLVQFFVLIIPANIRAAVKHIDYQKGTFEGAGTGYLWFRVPLQIFFIVWVYVFAIQS